MDYKFERKINYYETDKMGIVHHSNYIRFMEEARCEMLIKMGIPYSELEKKGIMIPVLGINCTYKYHVTFNDILIINLQIKDFTGVRMTAKYNIVDKSTGNIVATAETKHCFTNTDLKPINLKKHFPEIYDKFNNATIN